MYQRRTVWSSGQPLTASDLNEEFDAILAAFQEIGGGGGGGGGGIDGDGIVVNAGHDDFNPGGSDPFATRVQNAVNEAASGQRKVVWVPRWMWGYVEDSAWSPGIFNSSVLMVREGALWPYYDPIAYGAKIGDTEVNNTPVFQVCFDHAASADGPGSPMVAVTIPGAYQLNANVSFPADVSFQDVAGVSYTGSGEVEGWPHPYVMIEGNVNGSVGAESQHIALETVGGDPEIHVPIMIRVGTTNFSRYFHRSWIHDHINETGLQVKYELVAGNEFQIDFEFHNPNVSSQPYDFDYQLLLMRVPQHIDLGNFD